MKENSVQFEQTKPLKVHPIKEGRRVPLKQLMKRMKIDSFERSTPCRSDFPVPYRVEIKLKQHIGAPAVPILRTGDKVKKNDLIAKMEEGKLGANIHASIDGVVSQITTDSIILSGV